MWTGWRRRFLTLMLGTSAVLMGIAVARVQLVAGRADQHGWRRAGGSADAASADWPTFGFDPARSGSSRNERKLSAANVGGLHRLWVTALPEAADSAPILLQGVPTPGGDRDVLYLTTLQGSLVAIDAASGAQLWLARTRGESKLTTSSPVADPGRRHVYSYGLDGRVHRYRAESGAEESGGGWPVPVTLMPRTEKGSSALNAAGGRLYAVTSGYLGDAPPYQGHLVTIDLANGDAHVFNTLCSNLRRMLAPGDCRSQRSGIWARAGAVVDPVSGNLFIATGNGRFDAEHGGHDWGDSVLMLSPDGLRLLDSYTPSSFAVLERKDADLGSTAPALLPSLRGSRIAHLAVQGGKEGVLRLLDRDDLSGHRQPGYVGGELQAVATPGGCEVLTQPAVWSDPNDGTVWLFVSDRCAMAGYQVRASSDGAPRMEKAWSVAGATTSPVLAGRVLFAAGHQGVVARDPGTGRELWNSGAPSAGGNIGPIHWQSPIVIGGRVFCPDESGHVTAYGLE